MKIKWTNKWSGEVGYVKKVNTKSKYFENTFDINEAKVFTKSSATKALPKLESYCNDNNYEVVE